MNRDQVLRDGPLCASGKRGWKTEAEARKHLTIAKEYRSKDPNRGRTPGRVESAVYQCPACSWWHMQSAPRRRRSDFTR